MSTLAEMLTKLREAQQAFEAARVACCSRAANTLCKIDTLESAYDDHHGYKGSATAWIDGNTSINAEKWSTIRAAVYEGTATQYDLRTVQKVYEYTCLKIDQTVERLALDTNTLKCMHKVDG